MVSSDKPCRLALVLASAKLRPLDTRSHSGRRCVSPMQCRDYVVAAMDSTRKFLRSHDPRVQAVSLPIARSFLCSAFAVL